MKTDTQLQQDVIAELKWEPSINDTQIGVSVDKGIVTLNGHVDNFAEKWDAERAAQRVYGVKALAVEIEVKLQSSSKRDDADIARTIENILEWTMYVPKSAIKVMVENGWVTLTGQVDWGYQKWVAVKAIKYLFGVTGISDQIDVKAHLSAVIVKHDIESAFNRYNRKNDNNIIVNVDGTQVTLSGTVESYYQRNLAQSCAWKAPGVQAVLNNIVVSH